MSQTYDSTKPITGSTTFGQLYGILRDHFAACVSSFSGAAAPSSPIEGQLWYDSTNNKMYIYDGATWQTADYNSTIYTEVVNARGTAASLDARLDVGLNADGTFSGTSPAGAWWTGGTTPWRYYSTCQWEENGDKRAVYTLGRAVYIQGVANPGFSYVTACALSGASTIITIKDAWLDASMTTPSFGQENFNYHHRIPWTRALFSNSATSRDYAAANVTVVADGSGGVTTTAIVTNPLLKKYGSF